MSTTLSALKVTLFGSDGTQGIIQDSSYYSSATSRINDAVTAIAAGVRMPNGQISPPSPLLYDTDTVATATDAPYKALPSDYQRGLMMVVNENGHQIYPPQGGDYYSFALFLSRATKKDLSQAGSVSVVCVQGDRLYYQGIPSSPYDLTVMFYRAPVDLADDDDAIDAFPDHLATRLIQHYVAREIFGQVEDGQDNLAVGFKYHTGRFFEAMQDYIDWAGIDEIPQYYSAGLSIDLGVCD